MADMTKRFLVYHINTYPKDLASAADFASNNHIPSPQLRTLSHLQLARSQMVVIVRSLKVVVQVQMLKVVVGVVVVVVVIKLRLVVRRSPEASRQQKTCLTSSATTATSLVNTNLLVRMTL